MARNSLAFISYNPFTDQRIDPLKSDDLFKYEELPDYIHDAVARAKVLSGDISMKDLRSEADNLRRYIDKGLFANSEQGPYAGGRDYAMSASSDHLKAFLQYSDHDIDSKDWPKLLGIYVLSLAGEIVNTLWPSKEYLAKLSPRSLTVERFMEDNKADQTSEIVQELAIDAVRAAGFGEGVQILSARKINKRNAKNTHQGKEPIFDGYIDWVLSLPDNHTYRYQSHAEEDYLTHLKENSPKLHASVAVSTHISLRRKLNEYCKNNNIPYPFGTNS